jgi:hypothetical protein
MPALMIDDRAEIPAFLMVMTQGDALAFPALEVSPLAFDAHVTPIARVPKM